MAQIRRAYDILNALAVLQPTDGLTALVAVLFGIEDRAKLYYISGGKTGGDRPTPTPTPDGGSSDGDGSSDGGDTPTPTSDPTPTPTPTPTPSGGDGSEEG